MIALMRAFYDLAVRRSLYSPFADIGDGAYILEIGGSEPALRAVEEGWSVSAPVGVSRGSDADRRPNHGWDTAKYVLRLRDDKRGECAGEAFWTQAEREMREAGLDAAARAVARAAQAVLKVRRSLDGRSETAVFGDVEEIGEKASVVLAYKGQPLVSMPQFRKRWAKQFTWHAPGEPTHTDVVTGEPCSPVMPCKKCSGKGCSECEGGVVPLLHYQVSKVNGTGGKVPFVSFKYDSSCYGASPRRTSLSLPVSYATMQTYVAGLQSLLLNNSAALGSKNCSLLLWSPDSKKDHAIVPLALRVLGGFLKNDEAAALWRDVESTSCGDERVSAAMLRGAMGRVSPLNFEDTTAGALRAALLRFRAEFAQARSNLTFPVVAKFTRVNGDKSLVFGGMLLQQVAWSVVMGRPFCRKVMSRVATVPLLDDDKQPYGTQELRMAWQDAYERRATDRT